ncbi:ImmA/IrrE family metallo-endopeptidase [Cupriavidus sp. USMAA2-4]|uniref:ImmA/IrrE family metallo-endopeptidase n=1 Tax=Cupriavidus sp. USMAA2-4 TaxID=876364 RepID=UPI000A067F77|nr:ImmA/IrrE family metallo-endopeptidase [Cupriavidus sp. USMAA2-4]
MPARAAQALLDRYWDRKLPVDPVAIARAAGARVVGEALGTLSGKFDVLEGNSETPGGPVIAFNAFDPPVRQRFTIAHELGHFALRHGPRFRDSTQSFSLSNYDPIETAANKFAAELLMPATVVNGLITGRGISDFNTLAAMFNVSPAAMRFRLKNLGWL